MTINQLISGHSLGNSAKRGPLAMSDEELAMVYGGSFGDGLAMAASGVAIVAGAIVAVATAPVLTTLVIGATVVAAAAGGVVAGVGIAEAAK